MIPKAFISHETPGRLRFRIPSKRQDRDYFGKLVQEFGKIKGVDQVKVQPLTASVLILHHDRVGDLRDYLSQVSKESKLFRLYRSSREENLTDSFFSFLDRCDTNLYHATDGIWDLASMTATGMTMIGIYQATKKELFPPAWTLLQSAFVLLAESHETKKGQRKQQRFGTVLREHI